MSVAKPITASRAEDDGFRRAQPILRALMNLVRAIQKLFNMGEIKVEEYGRPSHCGQRIVLAEPALF